MKNLGLNEVREEFLKFFESKNHLRLKSASLIPHNDKSLLLINSGMAPLKAFFTGQEIPPSKRVTTYQKCIRTGDIENVGITARHGTFFEMLGNFSFGDYFKEEIIPWSWEFCTEVMGIDPERLHVSIYLDDDEAYKIWSEKVGIPKERIVRLGKEDNFWEVGLGPCGPCSEIYYDKGSEYGCGSPDCGVGCECDRYMEIWNLVFTQFNKEEDGTYTKLQHPNIDTGMGLERMATVLQNVNSIFEIDTLKKLRDKICEISNKTYGKNEEDDISIRIITDHARTVTFMIGDGILPSNEGRGYVLRRLLRRGIRHGKRLSIDRIFFDEIASVVIETSKGAYPELEERKENIFKIINVEEEKFYRTLNQGIEKLKELINEAVQTQAKSILGKDVFKLYDTYGFPLELTIEMLKEENLSIDEKAFRDEMEQQRLRARNAREESTFMGSEENIFSQLDASLITKFIGYDTTETKETKILYIAKEDEFIDKARVEDEVALILDITPFYGESGGQVGDTGIIKTDTGKISIKDTIKILNKTIHIGKVIEGTIEKNQTAIAKVNEKERLNIARNHTATHLLHKALRNTLGNHVEQGGSLVSENHLRFDFTHFESLTSDELLKIQDEVNDIIMNSLKVTTDIMSMDKAKEKGAMALFDEKYSDEVRVVGVDKYSMELCGGTHVNNTSVIGMFKITSESSVGSGLRRIEAITGRKVYDYMKEMDINIKSVGQILKVAPAKVINRIESVIEERRNLLIEIEKLNSKSIKNIVDDTINEKTSLSQINVIGKVLKNMDSNDLRNLGDQIKDKLDNALIILASNKHNKVNIVVMASDKAIEKGIHAGNIMKVIAPIVDGSGGGRPNMAQGGGTNLEKIDDVIKKAIEQIKDILK